MKTNNRDFSENLIPSFVLLGFIIFTSIMLSSGYSKIRLDDIQLEQRIADSNFYYHLLEKHKTDTYEDFEKYADGNFLNSFGGEITVDIDNEMLLVTTKEIPSGYNCFKTIIGDKPTIPDYRNYEEFKNEMSDYQKYNQKLDWTHFSIGNGNDVTSFKNFNLKKLTYDCDNKGNDTVDVKLYKNISK